MSMRQLFLIGFLLVFGLTQAGCASFNRKLKAWLGGGSSVEAPKQQASLTKFSDSPDFSPRVRRQYKRTTKESLADQSALDSRSGSLWVMEGQGAYLFSQNIVRLVGDPLAVTLEGDPRDQLTSKVSVIKKLLARIDEKNRLRQRDPAGADGEGDDKDDKGKGKKKDDKAAQQAANQEKAAETPAELAVKTVPTRIVERTIDGNYRVKGSQPFMIGNREYKIIVTGIVRAEEFNDEGIPATKLLDPKFDIVSARQKVGEM
ncbi:MAG: flagellar basal body L-ring protein FlgH [Bdellovibrionales bacterium]|nr:flagellar basal body L-ring protein FlgH [Bdellovibrionales bacterium]